MKRLSTLLSTMILSAGQLICAQSPGTVTTGPGNDAGLLYASNFGQWQVPQGNTGQFAWSVPSFCTVTASNIPLNPVFAVGTPIYIRDQVSANSEIVTPSAVRVSGSGCSITVSPVNHHSSFTLGSATAGLQEAINYAHGLPYQVILTPDWTRLGGTTAMITSAMGSTNVPIFDWRSSVIVPYLWNGSAYVASSLSFAGCTSVGVGSITCTGTIASANVVDSALTSGDCVQAGAGGLLTTITTPCTTGPINPGTTGQIAYYLTNGTAISGETSVPVTAGGTGATTAAGALANLGAAGWSTGSNAPSATCSSLVNNGTFYTSAALTLYQCSNVSGSYTWNSVGGSTGAFLPLAGGTMSGPIVVSLGSGLQGSSANGVGVQGGAGAFYDLQVFNAAGTNTPLIVFDSGKVTTTHNTLDDGSGKAAVSSLAINGSTPITSTSSATSQAVTCAPGGTSTQYCGADGAWHTAATGSGTINSTSGYKILSGPSSAGAVAQGTNITTDATGNNLNVPGTEADGALQVNAGTAMNANQGNGTLVQHSTGTATVNDLLKFDASGNAIDSGVASGWPYQPHFAYLAPNTPLAYPLVTLIDSSGNGYNGTTGATDGFHKPSHFNNGDGFVFAPSYTYEGWITIPAAATCGVNTVIALFTPASPNPVDANGTQWLLADPGSNGIMIQNSYGGVFPASGAHSQNAPTDLMYGNIAFGFTTAGNDYIYGVNQTSTVYQSNSFSLYCGSGNTYIGHNAGIAGSSGFAGSLQALIGFTQTLTQAQVEQALSYATQQIQAYNGVTFAKPPQATKVWYQGDSRSVNFGSSFALNTSRGYYVAKVNSALSAYQAIGLSGTELSLINGQLGGLGTMLTETNNFQILHLDAIINDIYQGICTSAAACFATIQASADSTHYGQVPNMTKVYATALPFGQMTSARETIRQGTNALVVAGAIAGTLNYQGVDDIATDPIAATQTAPTAYLPNQSAISVSSCSYSSPNETCTLSSPLPSYECYAGSVLLFAGAASQVNGNKTLTSCTGSTVVFPVASNPGVTTGTATWVTNGNWYVDGTHEGPALYQELSTQDNVSMLAAQGALNTCTLIKKQIPWQVPAVAGVGTPATTLTLPVLQLFPGWQVCSLSVNVTTAYTGPTTLTMSIGDSTGTATQYLAPTNLMATGTTIASPPTFASSNGVVQLNFISTVANINAITGGNVNVNIGVIVRP